jgi:cytochrome c peroxidase
MNKPCTNNVCRSRTLVGATLLLATLLAGCGGGGGGDSGSPTSATTVSTPVAPGITTPAGVSAFTTLDFNVLDNYATPTLPAYYDASVTPLDNAPNGGAISNRIATLGRVLFYDKRLSVNDAVSCASCHQQASGFSDPKRFSAGFTGTAFTSAHAMRLGNVRYYRPGSMFWDRRAASVEAQATQPIQNEIEMGWTPAAGGVPGLINKMGTTAYYSDLFSFAFGDAAITEARIQTALAQFERSMVSTGSRWDAGYATVFSAAAPNRNLALDLPNLTAEENRGRALFINAPGNGGVGCAACHVPPTFALAANADSNGLDAGETRLFKSPSLKNIGVGGPYMHDGRFATLEEVVEHYSTGVKAGPALDQRLRAGNGAPRLLNLSAADKAALVAFMKTLDDSTLNTDRKFADPFKR